MFSGEFVHTMDDKGRVFLPARHRDALAPAVMVGRGLDGQVNVYPKPLWEGMVERVRQAIQAGEDSLSIRQAQRLLFSAGECELDRQGRIVIPPLMRRYADLDTEVVILGNNDRLELWNRDRWQEVCMEAMAKSRERGDDPKQVARVGLSL